MQTKAQKRRGALARMAEAVERGVTTYNRLARPSSVTLSAEELRRAAVNGSDETVLHTIRVVERSRDRRNW